MKIMLTNPYEDEFVKLYKKENKGVERMTENKRFKLDGEVGFIDSKRCGGDTMTHFEVVVKLNNLYEENEQLKTQLQNTSDQRDEFHRGARENANYVGKLKKENEQLKKLIHIADGLIGWNTIPQVRREWEKQKKGDAE